MDANFTNEQGFLQEPILMPTGEEFDWLNFLSEEGGVDYAASGSEIGSTFDANSASLITVSNNFSHEILGEHVDVEHDLFRFESGSRVIEDKRISKPQRPKGDRSRSLKCEVQGCKYTGTFKRLYELQRHMDNHSSDRHYSCPASGCMTLQSLCVHLRMHRSWSPLMHALINVDIERCPMEGCNRSFSGRGRTRSGQISSSVDLTAQHLMRDHPCEDRLAQSALLAKFYYAASDAALCCPICGQRCTSTGSFVQHVENYHVLADPLRHHLELLQNCAGLAEARDTIARRWPKFKTHPVFKDLVPESDKAVWTSSYYN
ncbi:hypothetical protein NA57DRAFT_59106 [Rhizodiscina lignyota]|uniref:C2H2-type domain-containing protein n=1 Tax=Rhizodiscina lignyota TaxID=1504668 RepID=A0A9P4ICK3_9PEZI|nr:hypothetical protein NA57DRAFT_59106 [Rhizodiscina lignyota]